jgi:predicted RNA-binding Zn ribbon-like protein
VHLNPYGQDAVLLAADLANDPPETPEELTARCLAAGVVDHTGAGADDLATTRDLLDTWCAIVDAPDVRTRVDRLNALLAASTAHPRLTDHAGGWHVHYRHDHLPLGGILRALFATGTALHLTGRGMHRLGRCAADGCDRVYADVSRTGRQRYCSPRCANRDAVRRHRASA